MTPITVRRDSHYVVEGEDVTLVDWEGHEYQIPNRSAFALCRCGGSSNKPFCDGSHARIGFLAGEAALPAGMDNPRR